MRRLQVVILLCGCLVAIQTALIQRIIPFRALLSSEPFYNQDYGKTFYYAELGRGFLSHGLRFNGYSPDFYAGYLTHPTYHATSFVQVLGALLPTLPTEQLIKLWVYLLPISLPFLYGVAGWLFRLKPWELLAAAVLGVVSFWTANSFYLYWVGSFAFLWALHLAPVTGGLLVAWLRERRTFYLLCVGVVLPIQFLVHPFAILAVAPFIVVPLWAYWRSMKGIDWLGIVVATLVTLAVNAGWLVPFLTPGPGVSDKLISLMKEETYFHRVPPGITFRLLLSPLYVAFYLWAAVGCRTIYKRDRTLGLLWIALWLFSYAYNILLLLVPQLFFLSPIRCFPSLLVYLTIPGGVGLAWMGSTMRRMSHGVRLRKRLVYISCVLLFAAYSLAWFGITGFPLFLLGVPRPFVTHMPENFKKQAQWLLEHTDTRARILFEDDKIHTLFNCRRVVPIQRMCKGYFIGGPSCDSNSRALLIDFHDGRLGFRKLEAVSTEEIERFIETYNVGWVACWSEEASRYFHSREHLFRYETRVDDMDFFSVRREPSYFLLGKGKLKAYYDRLELSEIEPEDGCIRLSFHFACGMRLEGKGVLRYFSVEGDPVPLIELCDSGDRATIYYDPPLSALARSRCP